MTNHYRPRRILINLVPCLFVFSLYYYINDFSSEIYVLQRKTQRLPNLTRVSKWNATLQKITSMTNETEFIRSNMVSVLQDLKKNVMSDVENMAPQIGLVESQSYTKILVISNWRSAGAFVSSIIGSYPATLLHTEVLKVIVGMHKVSNIDKKATKCIGYLKKLLTCDFTFLKKDENGTFVWRGLQYFGSNVASWNSHCGGNSKWKTSKFCSNPMLLETVCHLYPIHVFKLDRLYLETTKSLLEDSDLSHLLKIVYLVRDPRAIHASRQQIGWCKKIPECREVKTLCQGLVDDFNSAVDLQAQYPHRVKIIRYEDLMSDLDGQIPRFLSSLGLPMQASVKSFIYRNTSPSEIRGKRQGPFGRNPIETMNRWKVSISYQTGTFYQFCISWFLDLIQTEDIS